MELPNLGDYIGDIQISEHLSGLGKTVGTIEVIAIRGRSTPRSNVENGGVGKIKSPLTLWGTPPFVASRSWYARYTSAVRWYEYWRPGRLSKIMASLRRAGIDPREWAGVFGNRPPNGPKCRNFGDNQDVNAHIGCLQLKL
jgi:hypothetical protein